MTSDRQANSNVFEVGRIDILYVSASEHPSEAANGIQVVKQCNGMAELPARICLLSKGRHMSVTLDDIRKEYGIAEAVTLLLFRLPRWAPSRLRGLIYPLWAATKLTIRHKVIYGRHGLALLACGLRGHAAVPVIYECHAPPSRIETLALRILVGANRLKRIVVISAALERIIRERYGFLGGVEIVVAHDGCEDLERQPMPMRERLAVGYVGGFYPGRGLELIAELAGQVPQADFHLYGGDAVKLGEYTGRPLSPNIYCHGRIAPSLLPESFRTFDIAMAPYARYVQVPDGTNTVEYMSPLKLFEYMSYGKAIIASDLPAIREVLTDGENALLVDPEAVEEWKSALERLQDHGLRERLGEQAHRYAMQHHTWSARARRVLRGFI